jgi:tRNA A-37 threonylcarbamoyl transferase component Bud32
MAAAQTLVAGRYRLHRQLGAGGMGLVWLARDEMLGRDVAIKEVVPHAGLSEQERHELRFRTLREARTTARLNHANVVKIYDVVHTEEWPWIVMEFVPSRSLYDVIARDGPLRPEQAARVGLAMLAALTAAHQAGVLHRDVKPGNVLLATDGRVVLTDFGLATFDGVESAVTLPGLVLGSAQYVAPERAKDGTSTPEADLWSLGATLYAAVEGRAPYARSSTMATLTALATAQPDQPRNAGPLRPVLNGLLRRNPKDRIGPQEAQRLLLKAAGEPAGGKRIPRPRRGRDPGELPPLAAPVLTTPDQLPTITLGARQPRVATISEDPLPPMPPRRSRRRLWLVGLAAALAIVAAAGVALAANRADRGGPPATTGPGGSASHGASHGASPSVVAATEPLLGTEACAGTATGAPVVAAGARPGWPGLIDGWVWYVDRTGFRLTVPAGWTVASGPEGLCFREPNGTRELGVEPYQPIVDPVTRWQRQESALTGAARPDGYKLLGIVAVDYYKAGAEWEYTYTDPDGSAEHGMARCFITSPGQAYTLAWRTEEFDWQPQLANWRLIIGSFTPPPA